MRSPTKNNTAGFAIVEALLVIIVLVGIVGAGIYVLRHRQAKSSNVTTNTAATTQQAPAGTTSSIDQLTQQDAATEQGTDSQADAQMQQDASSANGTVSNVGGAYNEANL